MATKKVKESTAYENCIDMEHVESFPATLSEFMGISKEEDLKDWKKHWVGMPEFVNEENKEKVYKSIKISFRTKDDYEEFAKLVEQNLSEKTKSIWYPKLVKEENHLLRWIVE